MGYLRFAEPSPIVQTRLKKDTTAAPVLMLSGFPIVDFSLFSLLFSFGLKSPGFLHHIQRNEKCHSHIPSLLYRRPPRNPPKPPPPNPPKPPPSPKRSPKPPPPKRLPKPPPPKLPLPNPPPPKPPPEP